MDEDVYYNGTLVRQWYHMPLITALGGTGESQADLCEVEANFVYKVSSKTAKTTHRIPASKKQNE